MTDSVVLRLRSGLRVFPLLGLFVLFPVLVCSQPRVIDDFEDLSGWKVVTSHGSASRLAISHTEGRSGRGMLMEFGFLGHMGSAAVEKQFGLTLPDNYQISFDIRGEAEVNNIVLRFVDSLDNVWVVTQAAYAFPRAWTRMTIKKHQLQYGWGPSGGGELRRLDRFLLMIDVVEGGTGRLWLDNLTLEPLDDRSQLPPRVTASSWRSGSEPLVSGDGRRITRWQTLASGEAQSLVCDFRRSVDLGGILIDWDSLDYATSFEVLLSDDGRHWKSAYAATRAAGGRSYVYLPGWEGRWLRLDLHRSSRTRGYAIVCLEFKGPEFGFSINDFFGAIASDSPPGRFPKYLRKEQSYWTVIGAPGDTREALMNEQGMIETDRLGFSVEPFLLVDTCLVTWQDVRVSQALEEGYLPIPSVRWEHPSGLRLTTTAHAAGPAGRSTLFAKYTVMNTSSRGRTSKLFLAVRPFQVNPPWQTFTIVGGAARIDSIRCDHVLTVNGRRLVPLTRPSACGAAEFDEGDVTAYLARGEVPPSASAHDHFGYASAALEFDVDLAGGAQREVIIAVPFHPESPAPSPDQDDATASRLYGDSHRACSGWWRSKLNAVSMTLPPSAGGIVNAIRSNLGYVLINADGPGTQPGSRSYERSWIRDGAMTSAALLQMGISEEVRRYIDWYATFQYADGMVPAIVESRGPDPTPEHDSHGQFLYMIMQYFRFTRDTTWLRAKWPSVVKTVRYIRSLRAQRKTALYRTGTPEQQACYGLVPESISHEGYTPKPMHSYWDNFFVMRGLKDATAIAEVLGRTEAARVFGEERDDFRKDLYASLERSMKNKNISFIPGCVELGDFSALSTTVAITPCDELQNLPSPALATTFDQAYRELLSRMDGTASWSAYLPYEARFIGAWTYMGRQDRAHAYLRWLLKDRRPEGWNVWAEVVWNDRNAPRNIGDMPHSWAASDFIRSVRSMLAYERESDEALVVGAGITEEWVREAGGVSVRGLPTYFGRLDFSMRQQGDRLVIDVSGDLHVPRGGIVIVSALGPAVRSVKGDAVRGTSPGEVIVSHLPAHVELTR